MLAPKFYEVGGCLRDELLGIPKDQIKDIDLAVEGFGDYGDLGQWLEANNYKIVDRYEDKFTYRAQTPQGKWYDFVWCRRDGHYVDGDMLNCCPGSIRDDLDRRDFTINAMARPWGDEGTESMIDPHYGQLDIETRTLRAVGDPKKRFTEDPRRLTRGIRFAVKYDLKIESKTLACYDDPDIIKLLINPKYKDKIKEEMDKAFRANTLKTIDFLSEHSILKHVLFNELYHNLHLITSSKRVSRR